jgi:hypothetical protein
MNKKYLITPLIFLSLFSCSVPQTQVNPPINTPVLSNPSPTGSIIPSIQPTILPVGNNSSISNSAFEFPIGTAREGKGAGTLAVNKQGKGVYIWHVRENPETLSLYGQLLGENLKPAGDQFKINTIDIDGKFIFPAYSASIDKQGNFVVSWQNKKNIYIRQFDNMGVAKGPEFIPEFSEKIEFGWMPDEYLYRDGYYTISTQTDQEGNFLLKFSQLTDNAIIQLFSKDGKPKKLIRLKEPALMDQVVMSPDGNFLVLSQTFMDTNQRTGQRYDKDGNPVGEKFNIKSKYFTMYRQGIGLDMDSKGNFIIAGLKIVDEEINEVINPTRTDIYAQKYDINNQPAGVEFKVNSGNFGPNLDPPAVVAAINDNGDMAFSWDETLFSTGAGNIFGRRFNSKSEPKENQFQVNYFTRGVRHNPNISMKNNGDFIITWFNQNTNTLEKQVYARTYNSVQPLPFDDPKFIPPENINCNPPVEEMEAVLNQPSYTGPMAIKVKANGEFIEFIPENMNKIINAPENKEGISNVITSSGEGSAYFENNGLTISPVRPACLNSVLEKYGAKVAEPGLPFSYFTLKHETVKVDDIEVLLRKYSKKINKDITEVTFTSYKAMQTYYVYLDLLLNYPFYQSYVFFNQIGVTS